MLFKCIFILVKSKIILNRKTNKNNIKVFWSLFQSLFIIHKLNMVNKFYLKLNFYFHIIANMSIYPKRNQQ